ncbi:HigA family addiction module antitoxin [Nesterenkonia alkaliphila]|uniref:HigA family addiction module antidote protein n=1 Tax=Nesterenkonia alkaliphila TaxID=1463631 RepID=A0A7K1UJP4_9MICC|nr:HigA family addiction module antitoxin [Nesterenkonia alkaliphila]MVT26251.1 HigA family addiction module antidote protein [Nesterenkonia alkaliphila]
MLNPVHPGEVIREDVLEELGLSVKDAAERLGVSRVALSRVLNARARISPELALRLEDAGVGSAKLWLDMQTAYDLAQRRNEVRPKVERLAAA